MTKLQKIKQLAEISGTLSSPSKMPCHSWSTPASACITGSKLRKNANSTCASCYACKGFYTFKSTRDALANRLEKLSNLDAWKRAMVAIITLQEKSGYFRWHDSGDIQSVEHLEAIVWIAEKMPEIRFWIPTREIAILNRYVARHGNEWPVNLTIRISSFLVGLEPPRALAKRLNVQTSTVDWNEGEQCPSSQQKNKCLDCRKCWDKSVDNTNYPKH